MRNAVIVAAADCVMFLIALITGSAWAAVGVIVLALAGLLLIAADVRADRRKERHEQVTDTRPALLPDDFAPDIVDGGDGADRNSDDADDEENVTRSTGGSDEDGGDPFPFGEPLSVAPDPSADRPRSPLRPGG